MFNLNITALPMRRFHNNLIGSSLSIPTIATLDPVIAIPIIEQSIMEEELTLEANQILFNKDACYDSKERIVDLKMILSILRNWSRP
jgi:hypothetical protein